MCAGESCKHVRLRISPHCCIRKARLKVAFETSHYNPRYHSNCAFAPLRDSIKSVALTRRHGIPYWLRRSSTEVSGLQLGRDVSLDVLLPVHTNHRLSESFDIGRSSSSLLRFILLNCPHCNAFRTHCQQLFLQSCFFSFSEHFPRCLSKSLTVVHQRLTVQKQDIPIRKL